MLCWMPNSTAARRVDKRERLVEGAAELFYEQGVHPTTLADVAERADVPLGNVYYYFKTKDELVDAVLECRTAEVRETLHAFGQKRTPQARLKALPQQWNAMSELVARYGCPLGGLCSELGKRPGSLEGKSEGLFGLVIDWAEEQFRQLGRRDAHDLAFSLLARIQGAALLAQSFRDPDVLAREARMIDRWIDALR
jgi:TetR/AcrR family transcriptional regulator, transcriptional repressor for nem operon